MCSRGAGWDDSYHYCEHVGHCKLKSSNVKVGSAWYEGGDNLTMVGTKAQACETVGVSQHRDYPRVLVKRLVIS